MQILFRLGCCPCVLSWTHSSKDLDLDLDFYLGKDTTWMFVGVYEPLYIAIYASLLLCREPVEPFFVYCLELSLVLDVETTERVRSGNGYYLGMTVPRGRHNCTISGDVRIHLILLYMSFRLLTQLLNLNMMLPRSSSHSLYVVGIDRNLLDAQSPIPQG